MRRFLRGVGVSLCLPITLPTLANAQASTNGQLWVDVVPHLQIWDRFEHFGDYGVRIDFSDSTQNTIPVRPSFRYGLNDIVELHGGIGAFYTFVEFGNDQFELRPWQGVRFNWPTVWRLHFKEFFRLEERFVWDTETKELDFSLRFRLAIGTAIPLTSSNSTYVPISFEGFGNVGEATVEAFRNRGRLSFGLGQQVGGPWVVEVQIILQTSRSTSDQDFTLNQEMLRIRLSRRGRLPWWGLLPGSD